MKKCKNNILNQQKNEEISVARGYGNTPSMNTYIHPLNGLESQSVSDFSVCFDWLACTFDYSDSFSHLDSLINALCLDNYNYDLATGLNGYQIRRIYDEDTFIQLKGPKNIRNVVTNNLIMSGEACRRFESRGGYWKNLLFILSTFYDCRFSRFDLAIDYYGKEITMEWLTKKIEAGELVTRYESYDIRKQVDMRTGKIKGWSITFGNHGSMCQLQIYDKFAERASKNIAVNHPNWIRFEMRFSQGKAHDIALRVMEQLEDVPLMAPEILNDIIEFKVPDNDKNKSRWFIDPKWKRFLKTASKTRIMNYFPPQNTIESKKRWFEYSMPKLLSLLAISSNDWNNDEAYLIVDGVKKMNNNDLLIMNKYRKVQGLSAITKRDLVKIVAELSGEVIDEEMIAKK